MMTPAWILDIFAAIMLVVAAVSAARLVAARPWQRGAVVTDTDVSHLLMAIAMAGMLAASLTTLPNAAWVVVFAHADGLVRLPGRARLPGQRRPRAGSGALRAAPGAQRGDGLHVPRDHGTRRKRRRDERHGRDVRDVHGAAVPTLAFVFALILVGYTIWDLDQLSGIRRGLPGGKRVAGRRAARAVRGAAAGTAGRGSGSAAGGPAAPAARAGLANSRLRRQHGERRPHRTGAGQSWARRGPWWAAGSPWASPWR